MSSTKNFADKTTQTNFPPFGVNEIEGDNDKMKFNTGLPFWEVFLCILSFVPRNGSTKLLLTDKFLLVMMRLWLALLFDDLAYCFNIAKSTSSSFFSD